MPVFPNFCSETGHAKNDEFLQKEREPHQHWLSPYLASQKETFKTAHLIAQVASKEEPQAPLEEERKTKDCPLTPCIGSHERRSRRKGESHRQTPILSCYLRRIISPPLKRAEMDPGSNTAWQLQAPTGSYPPLPLLDTGALPLTACFDCPGTEAGNSATTGGPPTGLPEAAGTTRRTMCMLRHHQRLSTNTFLLGKKLIFQ